MLAKRTLTERYILQLSPLQPIRWAIALEKIGNKLSKMHNIEILRGYPLSEREVKMSRSIIDRIYTEHSVAHYR